MTSIASVADTAEEKFVPYYDLFMPSLKHIVENAVQKELRLLRGKTIECISLIGLAVGKEKVSNFCYVEFTVYNLAVEALRVLEGFFPSDKWFSGCLFFFPYSFHIAPVLYTN